MRVLIVDDARTNRTVLAALLERAGHGVVTASSGAEALEKCRAARIDAVLTDLHLTPPETGVSLAGALRRQTVGGTALRIALMTADLSDVAIEPGLFDAVLEKPVRLADLQKFLEGEKTMKQAIQDWLTEQFGDDPALFDELYGQYAADMKKMVAELEGLLAAGDAATLGERGHAMKGMALQIGDSELSEPCKALQDAGRAGDLASCADLLPAIAAAVAAL